MIGHILDIEGQIGENNSYEFTSSTYPKNYVYSTDFFNRWQFRKISDAFDFAEFTGYPFNVYVVVLLNQCDLQNDNKQMKEFVLKFRTWLKYKRAKSVYSEQETLVPRYVFTLEKPQETNLHANWVLHVPDFLKEEFEVKLNTWGVKILKTVYDFSIWEDRLKADGYKSTANYICKGMDPDEVDRFHLREFYDRSGPQGTIYGTRYCVSRSLGKTAQEKAGFDPSTYRKRKQWRRQNYFD